MHKHYCINRPKCVFFLHFIDHMDICIVSERGRIYLHLLLLVYAKISTCVGVLILFLPFKKKKIIFKNASKQTTKVSF